MNKPKVKREFRKINGKEYEIKKLRVIKVTPTDLWILLFCGMILGIVFSILMMGLTTGVWHIKPDGAILCSSQNKTVVEFGLPTKAQTDSFCISNGYNWGTANTLLCNDNIQCFKDNPDGSYRADCLSVK
jgi:hypothetical protein